MSIGKKHASGGEAIYVRRECLGVALHAADPVIKIIDDNEENVGFFRTFSRRAQDQGGEGCGDEVGKFHNKKHELSDREPGLGGLRWGNQISPHRQASRFIRRCH